MPSERRLQAAVVLILLAALAQGVFRVITIPRWAHFDEPSHFEVIRFITENGRFPAPDDLDYDLRQRISDDFVSTDCGTDEPGSVFGCLGFHQFEELPGYYLAQAGLQRLFNPAGLRGQVYVARGFSLALMLLSLWLAYLILREGFPRQRLLWLAGPAFLMALPGYSNMMASINNDVAAAAAVSVQVYALTVLLMRGPSLGRVGGAAAATALCLVTKITAWIAVPGLLLALWLSVPWRRPAWYALPLIPALIGGLLLINPQRTVARWLALQPQYANQVAALDAPDGRYALQILPGETVVQPLDLGHVRALRGQPVTVGAWVRAPQGGQVYAPFLIDSTQRPPPQPLEVGAGWQFHAAHFTLGAETDFAAVQIPVPGGGPAQYDGLILAAGHYPLDAVPQGIRAGTWGGESFTNLLINPSAERRWALLRPVIGERGPFVLNYRLQSLYSWQYSRVGYVTAVINLFASFWGSFAWGVASFGRGMMIFFLLLTLAAISGLLRLGWEAAQGRQRFSPAQLKVIVMFAAVIAMAYFLSLMRLDPPNFNGESPYYPSARYMFTMAVPAAAVMLSGLGMWLPRARWQRWGAAALVAVLYTAHMISTFTVQIPWFAADGWWPLK